MKTLTIKIHGRIPSKKNSKQLARLPSGRMIIVTSSKFRSWNRMAAKELATQMPRNFPPIEKTHKIEAVFYPPDRIRGDLTNKMESVMDLLVEGAVLKDDNWFVCGHVVMVVGEVDRMKPRVEVAIEY